MRNILSLFIVLFLISGSGFSQDPEPLDPEGWLEADFEPDEKTDPPDETRNRQPTEPGSIQTQSPQTKSGKISLEIKGVDIVDVLKTLASRADINVVIGKNVRGLVSLFLSDVDVWDAFEIVILANGLAYEKKADIVTVMTQKDYNDLYGVAYKDTKQIEIAKLKYAKAKDLSRALIQIKSDLGKIVLDEGSNSLILIDTPARIKKLKEVIKETDVPIQTEIFDLNYAEAKQLSNQLKGLITPDLGLMEIDERTNKIAITDRPHKLKEIGKLIAAFDEKLPQVLIDAQIIELNPSDKFEMGVDWEYWIRKNFRAQAPFSGVTGSTKLSIGTINATVNNEGGYTAVLDALRTLGDTKILSSPRVMAVNGQEASVLVGTREAYLTSSTTQIGDSASTTEEVNFVDVGIKLHVVPTISREGFITMKIKPEISSAELTNFGTANEPKQIPIVTTSEAETTVMVRDGTTIIIGGLRKDSKIKTVKKIPLLGDIPLIGFFARSTYQEIQTSDLVILLTPHLVSGAEALVDFSDIKPDNGVVVEMFGGEIYKRRTKK